jgi:flagellar protein FlgJ
MQSALPINSASSDTLATGTAGLDRLRLAANTDPKGSIKEAAKQFEALFMQQLMKSMRDSTMASGMLDNQGSEMATGMLDSQYATKLSGLPGGLADAIARQLERLSSPNSDADPTQVQAPQGKARPVKLQAAAAAPLPATAAGAPAAAAGKAQDFVQAHTAAAERVAAESGIPAAFMLGQAAHETGWGKRNIKDDQGRESNNLFGIKAGANWNGPTVTATTTEVIDGRAVKVKARFRAYASAEESFRDYANLIGNNSRYAGVMQSRGDAKAFAQNLQKAGYATDPQYADKLGRVINTTLRLQRLTT